MDAFLACCEVPVLVLRLKRGHAVAFHCVEHGLHIHFLDFEVVSNFILDVFFVDSKDLRLEALYLGVREKVEELRNICEKHMTLLLRDHAVIPIWHFLLSILGVHYIFKMVDEFVVAKDLAGAQLAHFIDALLLCLDNLPKIFVLLRIFLAISFLILILLPLLFAIFLINPLHRR